MKILIGLIIVASLGSLAYANYRVDRFVHPPTKSCTCGPTCPTPAAKPWPIPASMEKVR